MTNTIGPCKGNMTGSGPSGARLFTGPDGKLKRVLIAYFPRPPIIEYLKKAFEKKGIEAFGFHSNVNNWFDRYVIHYTNKMAHNLRILPKNKVFFQGHPLSHLQYRSREFLKRVREVQPDLVLIVRGWRFTEECLTEISKGSQLFGWWIESEERMEEPLREAGRYDHYFFMNSACVAEGKKRGLNKISLLHHSVDTAMFRPVECEKKYDWCFVGGCTEKRIKFIEKALEVSENAVIFGSNWVKKNPFNMRLRKIVKGKYVEGDDLLRLYSESRVVLNVTSWGLGEGNKRSGMNMRVLEVPACRACLLTDGSRDMDSLVTPGRHVVLYEGLDDFASKLKRYINEREERKKIASAGYRHVTGRYTYDDVADIIIDKFNKTRKSGKRGSG